MSMVVIPMLLMPLMTIGLFKFMDKIMADQKEQTAKIYILGKNYSPRLAEIIEKQDKIEIADIDGEPEKEVIDEKIDAAVIIPKNFEKDIKEQKAVEVGLIIKSTNTRSSNAIAKISAAAEMFNGEVLKGRFDSARVDQKILSKATVKINDVATEKETGGFVLSLLIPMFIVIWAIAGGQYTAIDVSAGEKERKTLESLLLTPAKRIDIVLGKFLAVSLVALTSVVVAIGSFYGALVFSGGFGPMTTNGEINAQEMAGAVPVNFSVDPQAILVLFITSLFLVLMFSAVILSISIFAKSFKEAQSYIGPSYMIVILPVILANSIPGFEPASWFFAVPAVNAVLLFKEVLMGTYDFAHIGITLGSLIIFSAVSIFIAAKIYSKEGVLFRD